MSIFTRYAMDALMKTSHPEINRRQCWNLHPHRTPCTTCKGHLPLRRPDLHPPKPCQRLGSLHRLRALCFGLPQRLHRPLAGAGAAGHHPGRQR